MLGYYAFLQAVLGPLMPFIRSDLKLTYTLASLHFSAFALGAVVVGVVSDRPTRRWGRRATFWGGGLGMAIGACLLIASPLVVGTILGALVMGTCGNLLLVTLQATLSDGHGTWSAVAMVEANVVASGFAILASVGTGAITGLGIGWRLVIPPAVLMLALVAIRYRATTFPQPTADGKRADTLAAPSSRLPLRFWMFWLVIALETGVEWCIGYWGASFLATHTQFHAADAATAMGIFFLAMLIGRYGGSRLSRAFAGQILLIVSLVVGLLAFPVFWLAPLAPLRLIGLFAVGLGLANVYPLSVALAAREAPGQADQATARLSIAGGLAVLLAPLGLGALADALGIGHAFGVALPLLLLALLAAAVVARMRTPDQSAAAPAVEAR
jgi:fucose permease